MPAATAGSRAQIVTSCSRAARTARHVPKLPAPSTATGVGMARSVSRSAAIPLTLWGAAATLRALFLVVLRGVSASYARCPTRRGRGEALLAEFVGILLILVVALLVAGLLGG